MRYATAPSPYGEILLLANDRGLVGLHLPGEARTAPRDAEPGGPVLEQACAELAEYFAGTRRTFDVVDDAPGTAWQRRVWAELRAIPFGETITYAELARRAGRPAAIRAAGAANGRNPVSIVVPCHRVVGTDGMLHGYAGGLDVKRALLDHERAT
jgi:methylated-DNA-[protein]-cysteine S-methyltransferase